MGKICVLFDLDGTLLDSGEGITKGVEIAVEKFNKPKLDLETRKRFIGPSLRESFMKYCGADEAEAEEMLACYREYYGRRGLFECVPYEGIEDLLKFLKESGCSVYTATAKPTEYAVQMLEKWGLLKYFKKVVGASFDKSKIGKKEIIEEALSFEENKNAVMIGDTRFDIEGAKQNGILSIGVTYGFGDCEEICAEKPDYIAKNVAELKSILKELMYKF